jgi:alpha-tubulin suppressor-like RCC1 family protein
MIYTNLKQKELTMKRIIKFSIWILLFVFIFITVSGKSCSKKSNSSKSSSSVYTWPGIAAPSILIATADSFFLINLSWQDNSNNENGFQIERSLSGTNYSLLTTVYSNVISYNDNTVTPANYYYYRVRAYMNSGDSSAYSNEVICFSYNYDWVPPFSAIAASREHTIGIDTGGFIWAWGNNEYGQSGVDDLANKYFPMPILSDWDLEIFNGITAIEAISLVAGCSFARKTNGTLWVWGSNISGQMGTGTTYTYTAPFRVNSESDWLSIAGGGGYAIALKTNRSLYAWGRNNFGQLGLSDETSRPTPTQVTTTTDWSIISTGGYDNTSGHSLAIKANGNLWVWGKNNYGQLGLGDSGNSTSRTTPTQLASDSDWMSVAGGDDHTIALKTNNTLWIWGRNNLGKLGVGDMTTRITPSQIGTESEWNSVAAGSWYSLGIKINGTLWSWGVDGFGQLGLGSVTFQTTPAQVGIQSDWSYITTGYYHTIGIKTNGRVWAWGYNNYGQLGLGDTFSRDTPTLIGN